MSNIIDLILKNNYSIFGSINKVEKINVGFTNTIYSINDSYIVKICTNIDNEESFLKEIEFYKHNQDTTKNRNYYEYTKRAYYRKDRWGIII